MPHVAGLVPIDGSISTDTSTTSGGAAAAMGGAETTSNTSNNMAVETTSNNNDLVAVDPPPRSVTPPTPDKPPQKKSAAQQEKDEIKTMVLPPARTPTNVDTTKRISSSDITNFFSTDLKSKTSINKLDSIRPSNKTLASKVPPHWLATGNWKTVPYYARHFNRKLSYREQKIECEKYRRLSDTERRRLSKILDNMMASAAKFIADKQQQLPTASTRTSARQAQQEQDEMVALSMERSKQMAHVHKEIIEAGERQRAARKQKTAKKQKKKQPKKASKHTGIGSSEEDRDKLLEREKKSKLPPRKVGEPCRGYGEQSDSMAHEQAYSAQLKVLTAASTCHLPSNRRNDNGNRFALFQLNQVEDTAPTGGEHSGRARAKPQLTMTVSSKDDLKIILSAVSEALKTDEGSEKYDVDFVHTKEQADERHAAYMAPRKRKPRNKRKMSDIQREEDPCKLYVHYILHVIIYN